MSANKSTIEIHQITVTAAWSIQKTLFVLPLPNHGPKAKWTPNPRTSPMSKADPNPPVPRPRDRNDRRSKNRDGLLQCREASPILEHSILSVGFEHRSERHYLLLALERLQQLDRLLGRHSHGGALR